jgi:hypothetical protein
MHLAQARQEEGTKEDGVAAWARKERKEGGREGGREGGEDGGREEG